MPLLAQIDVASGDYLKALHNSYTEEAQATLCNERNFSHPGLSWNATVHAMERQHMHMGSVGLEYTARLNASTHDTQ